MKKVLLIVLAVVVIALAYILYQQIMTPLRFQKQVDVRKAAVIERIKDIRSAERAFKQIHTTYTGDFDSLINFVLNDSLTYERSFGSADDSLTVAQGLFRTEEFKMAVIDTVFGTKKLSREAVEQLKFIPYGNGKQYILDAGILETESKVKVPVFECKAPFKDFLSDLDNQELLNLIDTEKALYKYPGVRVGSMETATNDAGNWE